MNFKVMSILDAGETGKYGYLMLTQVNVKVMVNALISGHDQISTTCWNRPKARALMFTPTAKCCLRMATLEPRKFKHLVGNDGSGWQ